MQVMDGIEATKIIRSGNSRNRQTPIIGLTANADMEAEALAAGMNEFLVKPVRKPQMLAALQRVGVLNAVLKNTA
jgi:CheY-like chemotaxis protein